MDIQLKIPLRDLLRATIMGNYTQRYLQELHRLSYTIAHRLIRRKIASGKLSIEILGLSEADVTHDCIVELFKLGSSDELAEIVKYFGYQHISIEDEPEELLFIHLRRLVFSIVNDNIFRLNNEADPAFGRVLRNLKIAVGCQSNFKLITRFDEQFLTVTSQDNIPSLPTISEEELQDRVTGIMTRESEIPGILSQLYEFIINQERYQRHVRVMSLAWAIKTGYERLSSPYRSDAVDTDALLIEDEARAVIEQTCRDVYREMKPGYVNKKKVDEATFTSYMKTVEHALCNEFLAGKDGQESYFELLKEQKPEMSKTDYLQNHRITVEYLAKTAKKKVRERLKAIL